MSRRAGGGGKGPPRSGAKPGGRPGSKPGGRPGAKPGGKPGAKPGAKPGGKPGESEARPRNGPPPKGRRETRTRPPWAPDPGAGPKPPRYRKDFGAPEGQTQAPRGDARDSRGGRPREDRPRRERKSKLSSSEIVVGRHPVAAVLEHKPKWGKRLRLLEDGKGLEDLSKAAKAAGIEVVTEDRRSLDDLTGPGLLHQGVILEVTEFPYITIEKALEASPDLVVVLDGVEDPRNLGAIARAAVAFGAKLLVVPANRAARVTASAHKAAAGGLTMIDVAIADNLSRALEELKSAGLWVVGAEADGDVAPSEVDLREPTAWVIGGEDRGLRRLTREGCDHVVSIPMVTEALMLNAADAATVLLYETRRQRESLPG